MKETVLVFKGTKYQWIFIGIYQIDINKCINYNLIHKSPVPTFNAFHCCHNYNVLLWNINSIQQLKKRFNMKKDLYYFNNLIETIKILYPNYDLLIDLMLV